MNIALTKEMEKLIYRRVATGMYSNASEVVRDALRHMEENDPYSELAKGYRRLCKRSSSSEFS